ncbi:MAG TPA: hypothetical protein VFO60_03415 [Candidatus Dormibacteraeota bacterium]|nr:hypothetical protein [Candidatus Dormibacteraeota bacterium]
MTQASVDIGLPAVATGSAAASVPIGVAERFAQVLERLRGDEPVPGMRWRTAEIGAHVAASIEAFRDLSAGRPTPYDETGFDERVDEAILAGLGERDPGRLADVVREGAARWREDLGDRDVDDVAHGPRRREQTLGTLTATLELDLNLHGWQLGRALGSAWQADPDAVRDAVRRLLPSLVDEAATRDVRVTVALMLRGAEQPLRYTIDGGRVVMGATGPADVVVRTDAVSFLLNGVGLLSDARAALTGRVLVYGRRPWLALKLAEWFPRVPHGGKALA